MEGVAAAGAEGPVVGFPVNPDPVSEGEARNAPDLAAAAADDSDGSDEEIDVSGMRPADLIAGPDAGEMGPAPVLPAPAPGPAHGLPAVVDLDALKMRRASLKRDLKECAKRVKREETG